MDKIVKDAYVSRERDTHHGVGQVAVKGRKESKPVLARQILAASNSGIRHREAASFSSELIFGFVYRDFEPALDQFMRGA